MLDFILSPNIYIPILMFACLMTISLIIKKSFLMIKINENVLYNDLSPYLKQHKDNPVNWQIWSEETLKYSKQNKNLFCLASDMRAVTGVTLWLTKVSKIMKQQT